MIIKKRNSFIAIFIFAFLILTSAPSLFAQQYAKRGDIKIVEIMFNPPEAGTDSLEYIEFYNTTSSSINIGGYTLAGVTLTIPANTLIPAKGRLVFSGDTIRHRRFYNNKSIKWKSGTLSNSGEVLGIKTPGGIWIDSLKYGATTPWPKEPNGSGASVVLCNEMADNKIPANWSASSEAVGIVNGKMVKGTPGAACFDPNAGKDLTPPKLLGVQAKNLTKILLIFSEPINETANLITNYSGIPGITSAIRSLKNDSVIITLSQPLQRGKFYKFQVKDIKDIAGNSLVTTTNDIVFNDFNDDLIITEIMYDNPGEDDYEFIELYNATTEEIPLGGLRIAPSVSAILPDILLAPGAYFVIAKDSLKFKDLYKTYASQWSNGELSNSGDSVFLLNTLGETIDSVIFGISAPWTSYTAGTGSSLTICNALAENKSPSSWEATMTLAATDNAGNKYFASPGKACDAAYLPTKTLGKNRSICGNIILDAGNKNAKYKWSTGAATQTITADKSGIYSVFIVNGAGTISDTISLTKLNAAAIFDTIVCMNEVVQFTDNTMGATNRIWYFGTNDSAQSADTDYVFKTPGFVTVKLIVSDSFCSDTLEKQVFVRNCTASGIENITFQNSLLYVYPNPSNGEFTFKVNLAKSEQTELVLFDVQGKKILSLQNNNKKEWQEKINLTENKKGIYFLQLRTAREVLTEKLVIY